MNKSVFALIVGLILIAISISITQPVHADINTPLLINEIMSGVNKAIEIYNNTENTINLTNYNIKVYDQGGSLVVVNYNFPMGSAIAADGYVVLHLSTGTNNGYDFYISTSPPILWGNGGAVELYDPSDIALDFVRFNGSTKNPPTGMSWTGITPIIFDTANSLGRDFLSQDTDDGSDWLEQIPSLGSQNIAQQCYLLTLNSIGNGTKPVAAVDRSPGCFAGFYQPGESISIINANPDGGWGIAGWNGTTNDDSTNSFNNVEMPNSAHTVEVIYYEVTLDPPFLILPLESSLTYSRTPGFDWNDVEYATQYILQYSQNDTFSNPIETTLSTSTMTVSEDLDYGIWYWRVRATYDPVESDWSEVWSFTIAQDPYWLREFGYSEGWENPETPRTVGDVNGDGINDLIGFSPTGVRVALGTGTNFEPSTQWIASYGSEPDAGGWGGENTIRTVADVNGDNMADIVGFGNFGVLVSLSTGTNFDSPAYWVYGFGSDPAAGGWSSTDNNRVVKDVNSDGMDDIVGYGSYGVLVSLSTGTSFEDAQYWAMGYGSILGEWDGLQNPRTVADLNGDGCGDVVGFSNWGVLVSLSYACETSPVHMFGEPAYWTYGYAYELGDWDSTRHIRTFSDIDGDNDEDLIGFADAGVLVSQSNGTNGLGDATYWIMGYSYINGGWDVNQHPRTVADVNGDGMGDVVGYATDGVLIELSDGTKFE